MTDFRSDDSVTIRLASRRAGVEPDFNHTDGRPRAAHERLEVVLDTGDWVSYEIDVPEASRIRVRLDADWPAMTPEETPAVWVGSIPLSQSVAPSGVEGTSPAPVPAGPHSLKVTARAAGTVIASIEVESVVAS